MVQPITWAKVNTVYWGTDASNLFTNVSRDYDIVSYVRRRFQELMVKLNKIDA